MNINIDGFLGTLPIMGKGLLGIFLVTAAIILVTLILNSLSKLISK